LVQSALGLGLAGYTKYFQEAEKIARNHLLATQLLDPLILSGAKGRSKEELALIKRAYGLVSGWGLPNQFTARRRGVFDAMLCCCHQSVQALHDLWCYATTLDEEGLWVNLHFSLETKHAYIECRVPFQGYLKVKPKGSWNLHVRTPSFTDISEVDVKVDGKSVTPSEMKGFLGLGAIEKGSKVELKFPLKLYTVKEEVSNEVYETTWISDTVVDINPKGKNYPIYSNRKSILEKSMNLVRLK